MAPPPFSAVTTRAGGELLAQSNAISAQMKTLS